MLSGQRLSGNKNGFGTYNATETNKEKSYKTSKTQLKFFCHLHGGLYALCFLESILILKEEIYPGACSNGSAQAKTCLNTLASNCHMRSL